VLVLACVTSLVAPPTASAAPGIFTASGDVGAVGAAGSASFSTPVYTVSASGADIGGAADEFHYAYRPVTGDARITVRVSTQDANDAWAKAGVMFRESLAPNSAHAFVGTTPLIVILFLLDTSNGIGFRWRSSSGGATSESSWSGSTAHVAPYYLRLTRVGNVFTAERSANGSTWTQVGTSQTIAMASTFYIGLANTAAEDGTVNTSTFDNVSVIETPVAGNDAYVVGRNATLTVPAPGVLGNDSDTFGLPLTVAAPRPTTGPANGTLTLAADGSFTYTPNAGFSGTDSFTYRATNATFQSSLATVAITVEDAYVPAGAWPTSFAASRYLDLTFPGYVAAGSAVSGAEFRHRYRSASGGGTTCYYFEVYSGAVLVATHGSSGSPVSCNATTSYVNDAVALPEIDTVAEGNTARVRMFVRSSAAGHSAHQTAELALTYERD
jgi:hypothetical protein